tara:strand:- start:47 stop:289 length:243 start_codon:yes stop_codon:yes gene_type:complete
MSKKICYSSLFKRINDLKKMRTSLGKKEKEWDSAFQASDWIICQIKSLLTMVPDPATSKQDIENRLKDILCVIDSGDEDE